MAGSKLNALNQALDIAGSLFQAQNFVLADEPLGFGPPLTGQTGSAATIGTINPSNVTITGLTGMTAQSVGHFLQLTGANSGGNNGIFYIDTFISSSSVTIVNPNAVSPDTNSGSITWTERLEYSLENDLNYARTDRAAIKGTNYYSAIPNYQRPDAIGTNVAANLTNIAGKTTDAVAYTVNRAFFGATVASSDGYIIITAVGALKHADSVNETGVPCFDTGPFSNDWQACYTHITNGTTGNPTSGDELVVLTGPHAGERVFGVTYDGYSSSPDSVEVKFYSAPFGVNYATNATAYVWEAGQPTTINCLYGYNERLDQLDENAFRTVPALGILTDATLQNEVNNILDQIGSTSSLQNLSTLLTNTGANFSFFNLPNATPTVVDALNTLNSQVGDRTYTGTYLTSGETIAASLQALSNAITGSNLTRTIERLSSGITANTAHTLPGGLTYVTDGTNNGQNMFVWTRGLLKDPGPASGFNDYAETSTTSVTFYFALNAGDHINYLIK